MSTAGTAKPWDIRDGETSKQFEAFQEYLLLGPSRSFEATRLKLGKNSAGYIRTLEAWATANDWVARARSYDASLAAKKLLRREKLDMDGELEKLRADMMAAGERSMAIGERMQRLALKHLERLEASDELLKPNEIGLMFSRGEAMVLGGSDHRAAALGVSEIAAGLDVGSASAGGGEGPPETGEGGETFPALAESEAAPGDGT